jgi:hypothetical protein
MILRRAVEWGLSFVAVSILATVLLPVDNASAAYTPDVAGARSYANDFCPDVTYPEQKIADVMWVTAPGGGNQVTVVEGQSQNVPVIINFFATYCAWWPQGYTNGATDLEARHNGVNRLSGGPGSLTYGAKSTGGGVRDEWGVGQYNGTLNVAGLASGTYQFCTWFTTTTTWGAASFIQSPNICFDIQVIRINPWTINGQSYIQNSTTGGPRSQGTITANLNDVVHWDHDLRNNSAYNMDRTLYYNVDKTGYSGSEAGINGNKSQTGNASGTAGQLFVTLYAPGSPYTVKTIGQQDVGAGYNGRPEICQRIAWQDKAWNDGGWGWSVPWACVRVPYNYYLTPAVSGPNGVTSVGSPIPAVMPTINNQLLANPGQTTVSESVQWQLKRIQVAPGGSIPMVAARNGTAPCAHYGNTCIDKGSGTQAFPAGSTPLAALNGETVGANTPVGTRICYTLSVQPYTQSSPNWHHSVPVCMTVSKQPKMQVWGGDVRSRGDIETGTTLLDDAGTTKLFGSWVEYGGFSVGANSGFASGAGLNNGTTNTTTASTWHQLTFANIDNSGASSFGRYTLDGLPTITDQFIGAPSGNFTGGSISALASGTYQAGNVSIDASTVGQQTGIGKSIIIVSSGTVIIDGNITYTGEPFTALTQIPQVVIIANTINITNNAGRVDAWLLTRGASGMINTCYEPTRPITDPLNSTRCQASLTVNGPVVTNHLHLRRTAGSDNVATAGAPAEVFNLRPDAYVWAYARASQAGKAQTVDSIELPPRF